MEHLQSNQPVGLPAGRSASRSASQSASRSAGRSASRTVTLMEVVSPPKTNLSGSAANCSTRAGDKYCEKAPLICFQISKKKMISAKRFAFKRLQNKEDCNRRQHYQIMVLMIIRNGT